MNKDHISREDIAHIRLVARCVEVNCYGFHWVGSKIRYPDLNIRILYVTIHGLSYYSRFFAKYFRGIISINSKILFSIILYNRTELKILNLIFLFHVCVIWQNYYSKELIEYWKIRIFSINSFYEEKEKNNSSK